MDTAAIVNTLWESYRQGDYCPAALVGKLDVEAGYRAQLGLLDRWLSNGQRQAGWKVGLTANAMREMFVSDEPAFGFLLQRGSLASASRLRFDELRSPMVENEILITLDADLAGPGVTADDARQAIQSIAPALEIVDLRGADMRVDMPLAIADNLSQHAFVHGAAIQPAADFDFRDVEATVRVNGRVSETVRGGAAMDHQLDTVAWLANALHRFGRSLRAGQQIMSGSFTRPVPVSVGDVVETHFSGVGSVSVHFD